MPRTKTIHDQRDMKLHNRASVWKLILESRPISRAQLARITDMSPTSIARIIGELLSFGLLRETPTTHVGVGRKATMLDIDADAVFSVGLDIDVDALRICLLDLENKPRAFHEKKLRPGRRTPGEMVEKAHAMHREILAASGVAAGRVQAVGVSVGGTVDNENGVVTASPQLHWRGVPLRRLVAERFRLPVVVENDAKASVYEGYVRHEEYRANNLAYLTIGFGLGSGVIHDGKLLRGGNNAAGEIGHITVDPKGELCDCGRRGCLYTCLSEGALLKKIRRAHAAAADIDHWARAKRQGEKWAVRLAAEVGGHVAIALNHLLCCYDPEIVVAGGRLFQSFPELLDMALATRGIIYEALRPAAQVMHSLSPCRDAAVGAALLAKAFFLEQLIYEGNL